MSKHALASIGVFPSQWYFLFANFIEGVGSLQPSTTFPNAKIYIFTIFPIFSFRYLF